MTSLEEKFKIGASEMKKIMSNISPMFNKNGFDSVPKILFIINNNKVKAYTTNGENYTEVSFECNILNNGEFIVSGEKLNDIIKSTTNEEITFSITNDNKLSIVAGRTKFNISLIETNKDYLIANEINNAKSFFVDAQDLKSAINMVNCCINPAKSSLNGIVMHSNDDNNEKIFIAATDAMKLGVVERKAKLTEKLPNLMIPRKSAEYIMSIIGEMQGELEIKYTENMIQISTGSIIYTSKLLEYSFPSNYQSVIPLNNDKVLECDVNEIKKDIKSTTSMCGLDCSLRLQLSKDNMVISCEDNGEISTTNIEATYTSNEELDLSCNAHYMIDIFDKIPSSLVRISFLNNSTPMLIRPYDDESVKYVLMPIVK